MDFQYYLNEVGNDLRLKNYSWRTVKAYKTCLTKFFVYKKYNLESYDEQQIKKFILELFDKNYAPKSIGIYINAIRYFYKNILGYDINLNIPYPKRANKLPVVLTRNEIQLILDSITNPKHKTAIALAYSSGLRVSEVRKLRVQDIDVEQLMIRVRAGKGNKDRRTIFSEKLIPDLLKLCKNKRSYDFVFHSEQGGSLHERTLQKIFQNALVKSGVLKSATFHSLRHSFATHLLENGTSIRYVQELLGHTNIRTTQRYTAVTNMNLVNIVSPY